MLNQKSSLFVTRPSLYGYITNREELEHASNDLFSLLASGAIKVEVTGAAEIPAKKGGADASDAGEPQHPRLQPAYFLIPECKRGFPQEAPFVFIVRAGIGTAALNA